MWGQKDCKCQNTKNSAVSHSALEIDAYTQSENSPIDRKIYVEWGTFHRDLPLENKLQVTIPSRQIKN